MVLRRGLDVVHMKAAEIVRGIEERLTVIRQPEVLANLGMSDVVPVAEMLLAKSVDDWLNLGFSGDGFPSGQYFDCEPHLVFGTDWNQALEAAEERVEMLSHLLFAAQ